jgi:hypothetical protein
VSRERADQLQERIESSKDWPLTSERVVQEEITKWAAFRGSEREFLRTMAGWPSDRPYVVDPLPERIADAFADLIIGDDPRFTAAAELERRAARQQAGQAGAVTGPLVVPHTEADVPDDQDFLLDLVDANSLASKLQDAVSRCVAEREVWWRVFPGAHNPVVEFHSRRAVVPLFYGSDLLACAFVSAIGLGDPAPVMRRVGDDADPPGQQAWLEPASSASGAKEDVVWRHIEIQAAGIVRNLLYRGQRDKLGVRQALTALPSTQELRDEWEHDLGVMLAGWVPNGSRANPRSQFAGIEDLLLELNEVQTIGLENARNTLKARMIVPGALLQPRTNDEGEETGRAVLRDADVYISEAMDSTLGESGGPIKVLQYDYHGDKLIAWLEYLADTCLTRARMAPQIIGRHTEGAGTGPALRARLRDTVLAANGKGRAWDDELPNILLALQLLDSLPESQGGFERPWLRPADPPSIERSPVLPEDPAEQALTLTTKLSAGLMSRQAAIKEDRPELTDEQVEEEVGRIASDQSQAATGPLFRPPQS